MIDIVCDDYYLAHKIYGFNIMSSDLVDRYRFQILGHIPEVMNCPTYDQDIGFSPFSICPHCGAIISLNEGE